MEGSVFKYEYSLDFEAQILGKIPPLNPNNLQDQDGQRVERRREGTGVRRSRVRAGHALPSPIRTSARSTSLPRTCCLTRSVSLSFGPGEILRL